MKKTRKPSNKVNVIAIERELARAHIIISLLSLGVISLLALGATQPVTFEPSLSAISVVLLLIVIISSVNAAIMLFKNAK